MSHPTFRAHKLILSGYLFVCASTFLYTAIFTTPGTVKGDMACTVLFLEFLLHVPFVVFRLIIAWWQWVNIKSCI
jgi:hypothetical protein